jgi:hypothetical protein
MEVEYHENVSERFKKLSKKSIQQLDVQWVDIRAIINAIRDNTNQVVIRGEKSTLFSYFVEMLNVYGVIQYFQSLQYLSSSQNRLLEK